MAAAHAFIAICPNLSGGAHGSPSDILVEDIVEDPIPPNSTYVRISDKPGLGIALNEAVVANTALAESDIIFSRSASCFACPSCRPVATGEMDFACAGPTRYLLAPQI